MRSHVSFGLRVQKVNIDSSSKILLLRSAGWSWMLELECCERKILLGWLELELVAEVV